MREEDFNTLCKEIVNYVDQNYPPCPPVTSERRGSFPISSDTCKIWDVPVTLFTGMQQFLNDTKQWFENPLESAIYGDFYNISNYGYEFRKYQFKHSTESEYVIIVHYFYSYDVFEDKYFGRLIVTIRSDPQQ